MHHGAEVRRQASAVHFMGLGPTASSANAKRYTTAAALQHDTPHPLLD
jgi:hypothetical protein